MDWKELLTARLWHRIIAQTRKLWVRVLIIGALALVALGLARLSSVFMPDTRTFGLEMASVDRLLNIISNSMLAVTTFSLTVMVTVYRSTASQWTPRIHRLIIEDPTTQNTLATFIGAYVYALTGIVLRETGLFDAQAVLPFFALTVGVLVLIVVFMIRWVLHLQTFGSLMDSTRQVERMARAAMDDRMRDNCLGAQLLDADTTIPQGSLTVNAPVSGYVQIIDVDRLQDLAVRRGLRVFVTAEVGTFYFKGDELARVVDTGEGDGRERSDQTQSEAISDAIIMGDLRTFQQDPRFGLMVMAEIGSKALSPGINDPGTAIDIITRLARMLMGYTAETGSGKHGNVWVKPLDPADLINDAYGAIARDGAGVIEVQQRLQKALAGLCRHGDPAMAKAAQQAAVRELLRGEQALTFAPDREKLRAAASADIVRRADKAEADS
ncbi:MAG: DUF2254 domain-containing protein [Octadecabacter sp.]|nr:DUF2254 domain-containing protein [Octadecabacter sp.]